jgi:hypothetical protein
MMRRLRCLFRRHEWQSGYDHARNRTTWTCRHCGAEKKTLDDAIARRKADDFGRKAEDFGRRNFDGGPGGVL